MKVQTRNNKVLVCLFMLLVAATMSVSAYTATPLVQPIQAEPAALNRYQMRTTSPMLDGRSSLSVYSPAGQQFAGRTSTARGQVSIFSYLSSRDSKKKGGFNRTWTRDNLLQTGSFMNSGSRLSAASGDNNGGSTTVTTTYSSGPRRVNGEEEDDPDPFMGNVTPVGETPFFLLALLALGYIAFRYYRKEMAK